MKKKGQAGKVKKREGFEGQKLIVLPKKIASDFLIRDAVTRQVYITDIGYYPKARFHHVQRTHGINQHILIYCVEGSGWIEMNHVRTTVLASQFAVIPANIPHKYGAHENDAWTIYWFHFRGEISGDIVELIQAKTKKAQPSLGYNENRIKLFEEIYTNLEMGYSMDNLRYTNMTFYHFLSSLLYEDKFNYADRKKETDLVTLTIELMQKKTSAVLTLAELAGSVNLSVSHYSALFRAKTGYSPIEYFNHLKVQKACQYLLFSDMPVKEMAGLLGVDDQYYFSRMFSRLMGISPTQYRKRNAANR
jgi:AraC family transcriptional regulator of arabinose operon